MTNGVQIQRKYQNGQKFFITFWPQTLTFIYISDYITEHF